MGRTAWLGYGAMGRRMVRHLGGERRVFNRSAIELEEGLLRARSVREAVEGAELIVAMVRDDEASRDVWIDGGALDSAPPDALLIDCSTLSGEQAARMEADAKERGRVWVHAPVLGSTAPAEVGSLVGLIGAEGELAARCAAALDPFLARALEVGDARRAATWKLAVNAQLAVQASALAETLRLLASAGVEASEASPTLEQLPLLSPMGKGLLAALKSESFEAGFPLTLVEKDLGYAEAAADDLKMIAAARARCASLLAIERGHEHVSRLADPRLPTAPLA